jgi:hypothetical protein
LGRAPTDRNAVGFGCRAGTMSVYWSGNDIGDLEGVANVADSYANASGAPDRLSMLRSMTGTR